MYKNFVRVSGIIFWNLFAFLIFWIILGALFWNKWQFLIGAVLLSIIPLVVFLFIEIKRVTKEFNNISKKPENDGNSDSTTWNTTTL